VAALLAARHGLAVYSCDDAFEDHRQRAAQAGGAAFLVLAEAPPERLFAPPADRRAGELAAFYRDAFPLVAADLAGGGLTTADLAAGAAGRPAGARAPGPGARSASAAADARPHPAPLLAEGAGLLPDLVAPAGSRPRAVFLVAADAFRRRLARARPVAAELLARCPDPDAAWAVWSERDRLFGAAVAAAARRRGLPVVAVDGRHDVAATADRVAALLGLEPRPHAAPARLSPSG
jgi:hypothetical protein